MTLCLWGKVGKGAKPPLIIGGGKSPLLQLHPEKKNGGDFSLRSE